MGENLHAATRHAARAQRIPATAACACGFRDPRALQPFLNGWRCYQCGLQAQGKGITEDHHILGKAVDPTTVPLNANSHRILSDMQSTIPKDIQDRAPHDPLAFIIHLLYSLRNFGASVVESLTRAMDWLRRLHAALVQHHGNEWWKALGLPPFWGYVL